MPFSLTWCYPDHDLKTSGFSLGLKHEKIVGVSRGAGRLGTSFSSQGKIRLGKVCGAQHTACPAQAVLESLRSAGWRARGVVICPVHALGADTRDGPASPFTASVTQPQGPASRVLGIPVVLAARITNRRRSGRPWASLQVSSGACVRSLSGGARPPLLKGNAPRGWSRSGSQTVAR